MRLPDVPDGPVFGFSAAELACEVAAATDEDAIDVSPMDGFLKPGAITGLKDRATLVFTLPGHALML